MLAKFPVLKSWNFFFVTFSHPNGDFERGTSAKPENGNSKDHVKETMKGFQVLSPEIAPKVWLSFLLVVTVRLMEH